MLSFSTTEKYTFQVDGKPYLLEALTLSALDEVKAIMTEDDLGKQGDMIVSFLENKAADKRTQAILHKVPIRNLGELFKDWAGIVQPAVTPGESEGSPEQ